MVCRNARRNIAEIFKSHENRWLAKYEILNDRQAEEIGLTPKRQMDYDSKLKVASMVYPVRFEVVSDDVRQAVNKLGKNAEGNNEVTEPTKSTEPVKLEPNKPASRIRGSMIERYNEEFYG